MAKKMVDRPVTAEEMQEARAAREAHRKAILEETGAISLVQFTVVAPGPDKKTPDFKSLFVSGRRAIVDSTLGAGIAPLKIDVLEKVTGNELYMALFLPALDVKRRMVDIEEMLPFGRLLNINVYDSEGNHIPRTAVGYPERACLVCDTPGYDCARHHVHSYEELGEIVAAIVEESALELDE